MLLMVLVVLGLLLVILFVNRLFMQERNRMVVLVTKIIIVRKHGLTVNLLSKISAVMLEGPVS